MFAESQVGGSGGLALGPVGGRSVGEFDVEDGVPERKLPRARRPDEMHGAVVAHPGDDPGVAVGDAEVVVVAPGSDSVADPDSLTAVGDEHTGVADLSSCDEPLADRLIEIGHLLAGIGHHERTCGGCVVGQRSGACRLIAVYDDLAALGE